MNTETEKTTLVNEIFDWDGWDDQGDYMLSFYKVKLKQNIGDFPEGTHFDCAYVSFQDGFVQFVNHGEAVDNGRFIYRPDVLQGEYKIHLTIGEKIQ